MTHLTHAEVVDMVEGRLENGRAAHVEACPSCREQAETVRVLLGDVAALNADVPEPSPHFWTHMSARVRDAVAAQPPASGYGWIWSGWRGFAPVAAAAALVLAVFSGVLLMRAVPGGTGSPAAALVRVEPADRAAAPAFDVSSEVVPDAANAEVWAVLTAAASDVKFDDAHDAGMHPHAAAIDLAVDDLTAAERTELGRLLQTELKRSSN